MELEGNDCKKLLVNPFQLKNTHVSREGKKTEGERRLMLGDFEGEESDGETWIRDKKFGKEKKKVVKREGGNTHVACTV